MNIIEELTIRGISRSKRHLSGLLGRAPNYICESRGGFGPEDLVHLRLHLLDIGGHADLVAHVETMLLEPWR